MAWARIRLLSPSFASIRASTARAPMIDKRARAASTRFCRELPSRFTSSGISVALDLSLIYSGTTARTAAHAVRNKRERRSVVSGNEWIVGRRGRQVNGQLPPRRPGHSPHTRAFKIAMISFLLTTAAVISCGGRERRAERLYREATALIEHSELDQAVSRLDRLLVEYPDTEAAKKAKEEIVLYRGLADSVRTYPVRRATDALIQVARALDRFHGRRRTWPESLETLVPGEIAAIPEDAWGRALFYERKETGKGYLLGSFGADGASGGSGEKMDLVVEDGAFAREELP